MDLWWVWMFLMAEHLICIWPELCHSDIESVERPVFQEFIRYILFLANRKSKRMKDIYFFRESISILIGFRTMWALEIQHLRIKRGNNNFMWKFILCLTKQKKKTNTNNDSAISEHECNSAHFIKWIIIIYIRFIYSILITHLSFQINVNEINSFK